MLAPGQNRSGLRSDAMMADAVGVRPSKQQARSVVYGARPAHEWHLKAAIWPTEANRRSRPPTYYGLPKSRRASHRRCGRCRVL
jgi:hypothetical protein